MVCVASALSFFFVWFLSSAAFAVVGVRLYKYYTSTYTDTYTSTYTLYKYYKYLHKTPVELIGGDILGVVPFCVCCKQFS